MHRAPILRKIYRYIAQANVPLPDRLQSYNIFESQHLPQLLTENMLRLIDPQISRGLLREEFGLEKSASTLNRLLRLDWRFVLADNDLRKVGTMTRLAGVKVHYPMLVDSVVEIANKIPSHLKIFHHTLRYFYKNAFKNFLPDKILSKSKHGFGMPFGVWMLTHSRLHAMAYAQQFLYRPQVSAPAQHMGSEAVSQRMRSNFCIKVSRFCVTF